MPQASSNLETSLPFRDVYSVSRLNREARALLEGSFPLLWLEGEISNLTRHGSGHWYFSLKDEAAQVRCAMFRNRNMYLNFTPSNGMQVLVRARISLYEARGEFQIIAEHMEEAGDGALRRAFDALKQRLHAEGLFKEEHKQPIPEWPLCVGVITSPTGAAIHDILTTLQRRCPLLPVIVYPAKVQGTDSAAQIAAMIKTADGRKECDVIILARGGGSLEDLWSFNDEQVARAIYNCVTPVVTGIGHEVDFTIADFVADHRAPTPTAAAELVSPNQFELQSRLQQLLNRLAQQQQSRLHTWTRQLQWLNKRLPHPRRQLQDWMQRLDEIQLRQHNTMRTVMRQQHTRLQYAQQRLRLGNPLLRLERQSQQLAYLWQRSLRNIQQALQHKQQQLALHAHALDTISPLATLQRGYAIATRARDELIIRNCTQVNAGEAIDVRLGRGQLHCTIDSITKPDSSDA